MSHRPEGDAASWRKATLYCNGARVQLVDKIVADAIDAGFVKFRVLAKGAKIKLQGLTLDTELVRLIVDNDVTKVRLSSDGADRCKFRCLDMDSADDIVAIGFPIAIGTGKDFQYFFIRIVVILRRA